jgi:DNA-directed RNA polymerase sigma subunit (sigma70/sigma32)
MLLGRSECCGNGATGGRHAMPKRISWTSTSTLQCVTTPEPKGQRPSRCRPRRERPVRPHAAADALALQHRDLAEKIAGNFARRTVHPKEDLLQLAMIGLIKAARRYDPSRGPFRPYGRTYANGEITHFLRDNGFLLKVPPTWREIHARGQRLLTSGVGVGEMLERIGISRAAVDSDC